MGFQAVKQKAIAFLFTNTSSKQTVLKNTFWLMLAEWVSKWSIALITILIGRQFGTEVFGIYSYWWVILTFLIIFADLGLTTLLIRDYQHLEPEQRYHYLSQWLQTKALLSAIVILVFLIILFATTDELFVRQIGLVLLAYQLGNSFLEYLRGTFRSLQTSEVEFRIKLIQGIGNILIIPLIFLFHKILIVLLWQVFIALFVSIYTFIVIHNKIPHYKSPIFIMRKKMLIKDGRVFALSWLFVSMFYYVDTIIIKYYLWYSEIWLYSIGYKLMIIWLLPLVTLWQASLPILRKSFLFSKKELRISINSLNKLTIIPYLVILPIIIFFSKDLIKLILWDQYLLANLSFKYLLISLLVVAIYTNYSWALNAMWKERWHLFSCSIALMANIILNFIYIPIYWIEAAAITTIFTEIIAWSIIIYAFYKG
jgi:O-antigen/teichoic acid export membrane protein